MFEQPWALVLLLLGIPWAYWILKPKVLRWKVGGFDPFVDGANPRRSRKKWSWAFWLGLAALILATLAVASPDWSWTGDGVRTVLIVDSSFSTTGSLADDVARQPWSQEYDDAAEVRLGSAVEVVRERELLTALRKLGVNAVRAVVTDRPTPRNLPRDLEWRNDYFVPAGLPNAAILNVWFERSGWHMHWARWGVSEPLWIWRNGKAWRALDDAEESFVELGELAPGDFLELRTATQDSPDDRDFDHSWQIPQRTVFLLPATASQSWETALLACWPLAEVRRAGVDEPQGADIRIGLGTENADINFATDPFADEFAEENELEAVARIAAALEPWKRRWWPQPRPISECQPANTSLVWPTEDPTLMRARRNGRPLAVVSFFVFLIFLGALRKGL